MTLATAIRAQVLELDRDLAVSNVMTMEELVAGSLAEPRFTLLLLGVFAAVAMLLSAIGVYGVVSYSVTQRSHEIGVRMAWGRRCENVEACVRQGMALVVSGVGDWAFCCARSDPRDGDIAVWRKATDFTTFALLHASCYVAMGALFCSGKESDEGRSDVALSMNEDRGCWFLVFGFWFVVSTLRNRNKNAKLETRTHTRCCQWTLCGKT